MTQTLAEIMEEEDAKRIAAMNTPEAKAEDARILAKMKAEAEEERLLYPEEEIDEDDTED